MTIFESTLNNERTVNCSEGVTEVMQPLAEEHGGGVLPDAAAGSAVSEWRILLNWPLQAAEKHLRRKVADFNPH